MSYGLLSSVLIIGAIGVVISLIVGGVKLFRRRWQASLFALAALVISAMLAGGGAAGLIVRAAGDSIRGVGRSVAEGQDRQLAAAEPLKALTPGVDWINVDEQFWLYDGFRDWWRVPVRYPYEIQSVDTLDLGGICKNIARGKSDDPNLQVSQINGFGLTHFAADAKMIVYRLHEPGKPAPTWGIFEFDTDKSESFADEGAMWTAAATLGFIGPQELLSVREQHARYWR